MFYSCMIQDGQVSDKHRTELETKLSDLAREIFADGDSTFNWVVIESGHGFTAAKLSTSSLALALVPDGTDQADRELFMERICSIWMDTTDCSVNEIVATAADASTFAQANN